MARRNQQIDKIDSFIGNKIYTLRISKGFSRQQLANDIDVTHQQLQKYERGTNRISAGRLVLIANALGTSVNYFYAGYDNFQSEDILLETKHQRMCMEVSRNFMKIENPNHQNAVNSLIKTLIRESA